ncbi:MAG TPA: 3-oxoacyl-[acyl-carrier-protein] reductase [Thermomicrobiaceae bacterium]|nr:3-oxoacyl-[acyl-carrier-protein] reductase [Thermomicrobiaceae bacterium]
MTGAGQGAARRAAIVTGATRGIGRASALRLARDGFPVVVNYRADEAPARALVDEITQAGGQAVAIQADVTDADAVGKLIESAINHYGGLDVLVNNAGITRDTLIMRMKEEDWDAVIQTNLKSVFVTSKAAIRPMLRQRYGRIINLTSVVGLVGNAGQANYAAAKAGIVGLTKSLARELGSRSITVNAVAPGFIDTRLTEVLPEELRARAVEQIPLGRFGSPEDVAAAVAFFAAPDTGYITGAVLSVDGGLFMAT